GAGSAWSPRPRSDEACAPEPSLQGLRVQALTETFTGAALAWAGPTAAPTVTLLMATTATRVRLNCDDIFSSPFFGPSGLSGEPCPFLIKTRANPAKLPKTT